MSHLKVLLVEDNEMDAELLVLALRKGGYDLFFERVETAAQFQAALQRDEWDIILSDHVLPRFSSLAALALLEESGLDTPFIIVSGVMGEDAAVAALKSGADDFLVKGKLTRLIPAIERALREARARREKRLAEKALAESERKYRQIIETSMEGVWVVDTRNKTTFVNRQMAEMLGYAPEQMLGRDLTEFMGPAGREQLQTSLSPKLDGNLQQYDFQFLKQDGSALWAWISTSPVFDEREGYNGVVAMVTDITGRKRAEAAVSESEARFRTMADAAPIIISTLDAQGQLEYINKAGQAWFGLTGASVSEKHLLSAIHPDDLQKVVESIFHALQKQSGYSLEYRVLARDEYRWLYSIVSPRFTDAMEFAGLISCTVDITERKQAEEALACNLDKEKLISRMVEFNSQSFSGQDILNFTARELGSFLGVDRCIVIQYQQDTVDLANYPERLVGSYEKADHIEKIPEAAMPQIDFTETYIEQKLQSRLGLNIQDPTQIPSHLVDYFAQYKIQSALFYDVLYRGRVYGRIVLHACDACRHWTQDDRDIVENVITHLGEALYQVNLYQKEQAARRSLEQSNLELEHFATMASHDLQGPLRKVITFGDMLAVSAGENLNDESQDYLARMRKATQRMQGLITDLLDLSRVNRKGKPFQKVRLQEVVNLALEDLKEIIDSKGVQVEVAVDCILDADQDQLQQALVNLIENGIKFARPDCTPRLVIASEILASQSCLLRIEDNGIGIQPEHFDRIFEVFARLHAQDAYPGTGIGLSLVKKIVERHHGSISLSSEPGHGATFLIQLPLVQAY